MLVCACCCSSVDVEEAAALSDELSEQMAQVSLVDEALAQPVATVSDADVDAEYKEMLQDVEREERAAAAAGGAAGGGDAAKLKAAPSTTIAPPQAVSKNEARSTINLS